MSDQSGGAALQPDMHLKPLDNAALLKPLHRTPAPPRAAVSPAKNAAAAAPPITQTPPVVKITQPGPKARTVESADDDPVRLPVFAKAAPAAQAPAAARPVAAPPVTEHPVTAPPAAAAAAEARPMQPAALKPQPVVEHPAAAMPVARPVAVPPPAVPPAPPLQTRPAAEPADPDDDASPYTAAPPARHEHAYRPPDEQMHMMELMKSIFASALNASLATGQPPQLETVPETPPPDMDELRKTLIALQQKIRQAKIPVVILIDGLSASGKGTMLSKLIEGLDSRAYKAHPIRKPDCVEETYPAMWRYWTRMPEKGNIALFCSSWYGDLNKSSFEHEDEISEKLQRRLNEIISMESQLICDGTLILKFFLHISRQEQYDRLKKMEKKKSTAWQVDAHDHQQNKRFDEYMKGMDNLMSITNLKGAPWHVLDAADEDACERSLYQTVIQAFEDVLAERGQGHRTWDVPMLPNLSPIPSLGFPPLTSIDLGKRLDEPYDSLHKELNKRLAKLQIKLYRRGIPMVIAFEGWDAAGKGGAIRRLNGALDARGFTVTPISAPTPTELNHHYMWRFWTALPPKGHITIFDRTWYGRVMVERVEGLCTVPQWQRAYEEINRFEKLLTDDGAILCKFWLQIDQATQLQRFEERQADPEKQWKITDEDWRNREKWPAYEQALNEVLQRTHTAFAPWTVVEANDKDFARIKVLKTVVDAIEKRLGNDDDDD